jgi:hypothetical protein
MMNAPETRVAAGRRNRPPARVLAGILDRAGLELRGAEMVTVAPGTAR